MKKLFNKKASVEEYPLTPSDCVKGCDPCCSKEEKYYEVTVTLTDKFYNDDVKKYLFAFNNNAVFVSDNNQVTYKTTNTWDWRDLIFIEGVISVTIKRA